MNFERLSKKQKRITIAKDVLKWLANGRMTAKKRTYLAASTLTEDGKINGHGCQACALGGLFACAVEVKKGASIREIGDGIGADRIGQRQMHRLLGEFFTRDELMNIENAFEGQTRDNFCGLALVNEQYEFSDERYFNKRAVTFNAGIRSPKKRMQRIMRNIIRNDGRFIP